MPFEYPEQKEVSPEKLKEIFEKIEDNSFITKEGLKRPLRRKLYANAQLRKLLLESDEESGEIEIMNVVYEIVNGRKNPEGKMVSIIHQTDQGLIKNFLLKKYNLTEEEVGLEKTPIVDIESSKFMTKTGEKLSKRKTIYATKTLRTMLGIEENEDEVEIGDEVFTVKNGRKLPGQENYSNFVHKKDKDKVLEYLDKKLSQSIGK
jgi:hypothetical protein